MDSLGYVYHRGAANLRGQPSGTVGLVITDVGNPIFAELMLGIERVLEPAEYTVLLANTFDDVDRQERLIRSLMEHRVEGLLIVPALESGPSVVEPLRRADVAHVLMMRHVADVRSPHIGSDDVEGGRLAATHLVEHGAQDVVYVGGPDVPSGQRSARLRGFLAGLEAAGREPDMDRMLPSEVSGAGGQELARRLMAAGPVPDGIVCHSDVIAFGLLRELLDAGVAVPERCRVIGFDDVEQAKFVQPPLTSVSVAPREVGDYAASMLLRNIEQSDTELADVVLRPRLSARASCGCLDGGPPLVD